MKAFIVLFILGLSGPVAWGQSYRYEDQLSAMRAETESLRRMQADDRQRAEDRARDAEFDRRRRETDREVEAMRAKANADSDRRQRRMFGPSSNFLDD
jgi:hypothetical protein